MSTDTDLRLRSQLDTNQQAREQMCRSILALDGHYSDVRPRHPGGGRDGGRDIEAIYDESTLAYGAVGFVNGANDSSEQKKAILKKFRDDLNSAVTAKSDLKAFVFFTNLHLTINEQGKMRKEAKTKGVLHCDVMDRERIRIELDAPSGFFIRFQYLAIPLSPAEQASFLAKYGDQVQDVVSTGFQRVEKSLDRLIFLAESTDVLEGIYVRFTLKRTYTASEIGHFRAFIFLSLRAITHKICMIWFGSTDKSARFREDKDNNPNYGNTPGIGAGIAGGQWERHIHLTENSNDSHEQEQDHEIECSEEESERFIQVGWSDSVGIDQVTAVTASYNHDQDMIRFQPRLSLRDLNDCSFLPVLSKSFAEKLYSIQVFSNGYKLMDLELTDFMIDESKWKSVTPNHFSEEELEDKWVRIRPSRMSSTFHLRFSDKTPKRQYEYKDMRDSAPPG